MTSRQKQSKLLERNVSDAYLAPILNGNCLKSSNIDV